MSTVDRLIRVALADDDHLVRAGIRGILESDPGIEVVVEAADGRELVEQVRSRRLDVVLVDIRMPVLDGLAALDELRRVGTDAAIAMLTTFGDEDYLARAVAAGVQGFCLKSDPPAALIRAVGDLAAGGAVFSPRVASWFLRTDAVHRVRTEQDARHRIDGLSPQLRAVLAELARGSSNADVADRLHLAEGTVKQYVRQLFLQLEVTNRVQAALVGYQAGLAGRR